MDRPARNWPHGVTLKPALQQAIAAMSRVNAAATASRAGCSHDSGRITVPFFNRTFLVHLPHVRVEERGTAATPSQDVQLIILHYLLNADGTPPGGMWITYRHVPDGMLFDARFNAMAVDPLASAFGSDMARFRAACAGLGGVAMTRTGDAAYRFMALPQIPMGCVLYLADEELSASVSLLFDSVAPQYLCAEDLAFLGIYLSESLLKASGCQCGASRATPGKIADSSE